MGLYVVEGGGRLHMEVVGEVGQEGARGGAGGSAGRLDGHCGGGALHSRGAVEARCRVALAPWVGLHLGIEPAEGELVLLQGGQGGQSSLGNLAAGSHVRPLVRYQAVLGSLATSARFQKSAWGCRSVEGRTQTQADGVGQAALLGLEPVGPVVAGDLEKGPREAGRRGSGCSRCSHAPQLMAPMEASSADSFAASHP